MQTAEELRTLLTTAIAAGRPVVLDLEGVNLVDSRALGVLVRARQQARRQEVPLCLAAPSRFLLAVLQTMRLRHAFLVLSNCASAIATLTGDASIKGARDVQPVPVPRERSGV